MKELPAHTEPFDPRNLLVIANGLLTGSPISTATRFVVSARSPLTHGYGESEAGGFWGPELKMAGFEAILISGRADRPVYLWIHDGEFELRPAEALWGRDPDAVEAEIRAELGDDKIRVLQIGIGGENRVRFAGLTNDLRHFNGRNGMGAVMGSKNLRAIAVRGRQRYQSIAYDTAGLMELGKRLAKEAPAHPASVDLQHRGTPGLVDGLNAAGILPTHNFRKGAFENVDQLKWDTYEKELLTARRSCYACAVRCKREVAVDGKPSAYGGPEYETLAAFGSNCGIDDLHMVNRANELCNRYMLDSISTGAVIAFAMECFEHGLIGLKETGGIELRFGNAGVLLPMIEMIARRQGWLGNLLAEGSKRAAAVIGGDAAHFLIEVKGQEVPMHDPRGKFNVGLGYAISEIGADHLVVTHDPSLANPESLAFKSARDLGISEAQPARSLSDEKVRQFYILEKWNSMEKSIGFCVFGPAPRSFIQPADVLNAVKVATGWDLSIADVLEIGERGTNLARAFNAREGFTRKDDTLPARFMEPMGNGPLAGKTLPPEEFEQALTRLYTLKGWDPQTGQPSRERLEALSLGWAADLVEAARPDA
jgi:aldehyde:ferredoxin oxidoreductase